MIHVGRVSGDDTPVARCPRHVPRTPRCVRGVKLLTHGVQAVRRTGRGVNGLTGTRPVASVVVRRRREASKPSGNGGPIRMTYRDGRDLDRSR